MLVVGAAAGLIASASGWLGLRLGRPLYYSDGNQEVSALELVDAGMLRWSQPEFETEIPGPVRGRVIELPDGSLLYGRARGPGVTDLVQLDPRRGREPRPVLELNSDGHDLAPVLAPGGRILFASDRPSGAGGFDIYTANYRAGVFFAVRPLALFHRRSSLGGEQRNEVAGRSTGLQSIRRALALVGRQ